MVWEADRQGLLSDEHFGVDGTLMEVAVSIKSFRSRQEGEQPPDDDPNNPSMDFRGEKLRNEAHQSKTDPESRLMRKGKETKLVFVEHALMENRNGLVLDFVVSEATGTVERLAVYGYYFTLQHLTDCQHPLGETALELLSVQLGEHPAEGVV